MEKKTKGVALAVAGASSYGVQSLFTRFAMDQGAGSNTILVYRFVFIFLIMGVCLAARRSLRVVSGRQILALLIFGAGGYGIAIFLLAEAYRYLSVGQATMIHCAYPVIVVVYMIVFFKERLTRRMVLTLVLTCVSIVLLMDFSKPETFHAYGIFIALLSGATFAGYMVSVDRSSLRQLSACELMLYLSLTIVVVFGAVGAVTGQLDFFSLPVKAYVHIGIIALLSIVGIGFMTLSIRVIGPSYAAMLSIFEPVTAMLCSLLILREPITLSGAVGSALMIGVLLLIAGASPGKKRSADAPDKTEEKMDGSKNIF